MRGRTLQGRFGVLEEIGSGAFSTVYLGRDLQTNEVVAVKALRGPLNADPDFLRRFRREARILSEIEDPHVVQIYEFGVEEGEAYIVMEYVQGRSLAEIIAQSGRLPLERVLDVGSQVCLALEATQARQVVHRDIKPSNILVAADGTAKLGDFGIAREGQIFRQTTGYLGTPYYVSPEQAGWEDLPVDIRSDIYSLGVVIWEMATGRVLFDGDTPLQIAMKHATQPPPPLRSLAPELPPELETAVARCLEKRPADRFQTPRDLRRTLEGVPRRIIREHAPSPPPPPPSAGAYLELAGGRRALLAGEMTRVGARRTNVTPDIDLGAEEGGETVHGRHLKLERRAGRWLASIEVGVTNLTTVDGADLKQHKQRPLRDGSELQLGKVRVRFRLAARPADAG